MTRRWQVVMGITLLSLCSNFAGCATKLDLSKAGPDGRGCIVGIVDSTDAAILRTKNPAIKSGDFVFTPFCAAQIGDDLLNEVYELTK